MSWRGTSGSSLQDDSMADSSKANDALRLEENLEVWKHIVSIQQHFNEIGWKIRGLAITALTFILGATFFGFINVNKTEVCGFEFNPSALVPVIGMMIWGLFWFADGVWYHRLLKGAGSAASEVESNLIKHGIRARLSGAITEASHKKWLGARSSSYAKLNTFYTIGLLILISTTLAVFLVALNYDSATNDSLSQAISRPVYRAVDLKV